MYNGYAKRLLFDDLIVMDCDVINIESSTEGKEEKKSVWTKRKDDEKESDVESFVFLVHHECIHV